MSMQIYSCLHDIITNIENQYITKAITFGGDLVLINKFKLKHNKNLRGANIFKMLFNLTTDHPYKIIESETDEYGNITILRDLGINRRHWILLLRFLETDTIPGYYDYIVTKSKCSYNLTVSYLDILMDINAKLGGIPALELFYENFFKSAKKNKKTTLVSKPEEDIENEYQWQAIVMKDFWDWKRTIESHIKIRYGWTLASVSQTGVYYLYYFKRKWKWIKKEREMLSDDETDDEINNEQTDGDIQEDDILDDSNTDEPVMGIYEIPGIPFSDEEH